MLQPAGTKHRKMHRVGLGKVGARSIKIGYGVYGLKAVEGGILKSRELEAGRMSIKRGIKKTGSLWLRKFPDISVTGKKSGVRMGKGKGAVVDWVCSVKPGEIIFELEGVSKKLAMDVLRVVGSKMSVRSKFIVLKE